MVKEQFTAMSLEQRFLIAAIRAGRNWRKVADVAARQFGLTEATALPLLYLSRMEDGPRQADLADAMQIERPSVAWLIDQLSDLGMVERQEDPDDKRAKRVHLTDKGRMTTANIQQALEQQRAALFASVNRPDLETGLRVLEALDYG